MRVVTGRWMSGLAAFLWLAGVSAAQEPAADPRVGLKAGITDAGVAARHIVLVTTLGKPDGFFDPAEPAGTPTPPERPQPASPDESVAVPTGGQAPAAGEAAAEPPRPPTMLAFANSDLAFTGRHLVMGNFHGFTVYDIADPRAPRLVASVVCPGGQGDVSVHGNLLFMSVEQPRGRVDCGTGGVQAPVSTERFRGVRILDISDISKPVQVAAVQTCRGSHTHTLVTNPNDPTKVYVYGSGTAAVRSGEELEGCSAGDPKEDANTALFSIDVIEVPLAAPETARIVNRPRIFADEKTGAIAGLWPGGNHGEGTQSTRLTNQCHDITVFPSAGLAAGACSGNGILMDISDPVHPKRLDYVTDKSFAYWHSATFNNDGTKVLFTDEWGGGTRPRCLATDPPTWGANAIFDVVDRRLEFRSYYKLPAPQTETENCVAHNGSLVPVPGRDIMVQAWYQGGVSVLDFTDSAKPVEIAFFDRGPLDAERLITGGYWSTYWYNGYIYGSEIARGLDVLELQPSEHLSQNELDAARLVRVETFNAQEQPHVTWPASPVVARAYMDQLRRTNAIDAATVTAVNAALDAAGSQGPAGAAAIADLGRLATQLAGAGEAATGPDRARLTALAATLRAYAAGPQ